MQGSAKDLYWFWWTMIGPSLYSLYSSQSPRDWMWRILYSAAKRQRFQRLETLTRSEGSTGPVLLWYLINISYQLTSFQLFSTTSSSSITFFSSLLVMIFHWPLLSSNWKCLTVWQYSIEPPTLTLQESVINLPISDLYILLYRRCP